MLFDKFDLNPEVTSSPILINNEIKNTEESKLSNVMLEVVATQKTLRNNTSPKYKFDEYFLELQQSLLLDGYLINNNTIRSLDPSFEGREPVEDALITELEQSVLGQKSAIILSVKASAEDFIKSTPDYNGSLTNIRIALETLVREIAYDKGFTTNRTGNTWGPSLTYLRGDNFITDKDEKALASIFTFISDGAHIPLGFSEEEFVRLGRNICASMCYFVIKQFNA
ncbi:hypothetical protein A6E02_18190 [Aliivibrio fischeri]|nr:hypothetical protein A6E02_18190 [Aliivibrio fischeri]